MKMFGNGRIALADDPAMAERLGWPARRGSEPDPEALLYPVAGDPWREPWITRRRRSSHGPEGLWIRDPGGPVGTYLSAPPGVERYLQALARPRRDRGFTVGISGLGRVGGLGAVALAGMEAAGSRVGTILVHDTDAANLERMRLELASICSWRGQAGLPAVEAAGLPEMLRRADVFLFAAATAVPPLGSPGDVRMAQFGPNRAALRPALEAAAEAGFAGLFGIVSDPVEPLAQAAFHDSNGPPAWAGPEPAPFLGAGLAPESVAGLALGVMWGRAMALAASLGAGERVQRQGAAYGPHSTEVLVFDDPAQPDPALSRRLTEAARGGNLKIRDLGYLPYIGPAMSSIALTLPPLLAGREVLTSHFVHGIYFGGPSRLEWGMVSSPGVMAPSVREQVRDLHRRLRERLEQAGLLFGALAGAPLP